MVDKNVEQQRAQMWPLRDTRSDREETGIRALDINSLGPARKITPHPPKEGAGNTKRFKFGKEDNVVIESFREVCVNRVHLQPRVESQRQISRVNSQVWDRRSSRSFSRSLGIVLRIDIGL